MAERCIMEKELSVQEHDVQSKEHYAYLINSLIDAFNAGDLPSVEKITVEPKYGYIATIKYVTGENRVIYGHDPGLNPGSSEELVKDKGYTKFILKENGINCPEGDEFLLPWWAETLRTSDRQQYNNVIQDTSAAHSFIQGSLHYPVYIKPSRGSQGVGVTRISDEQELHEAFDIFNQERVKVALVEEELTMPDYRLLVFNGELVNAYERQPLSVTGNGSFTVEQLIHQKHTELLEQGRDIHMDQQRPLIERKLGKLGLTLSNVIASGDNVQLLDISNLSAGGTPVDVMNTIHPHWARLAGDIAKIFNLRVCGVDLACSDITSGQSEYSVIEVNATPGAKQFMATGQGEQERLKKLFTEFFATP